MPGFVLCGRRWAIGSDDIFIPAIILFVFHLIESIALITILSFIRHEPKWTCSINMYEFLIAYLIILLMMLILEFMSLVVSCRGSVLDTKPRKFLQHIIYSRLVIFLLEIAFTVWGSFILFNLKEFCTKNWHNLFMKQTITVIVILSAILIVATVLSITCVYDHTGRSFHRLKLFEFNYRKYPNEISEHTRHLRHKETLYSYHENWRTRCKLLFCCIKQNKDENEAAFANIAETLSCFFYKYDVVPSDILAGLLLIREKQRLGRTHTLIQKSKGIYDYLSGVPVTSSTKFFKLNDMQNLKLYKELVYFADYAAASYGWPFYLYRSKCALLQLLPSIKYSLCIRKPSCLSSHRLTKSCEEINEIENDNCCFCYYSALVKQLPETTYDEEKNSKKHVKIVHANFSSDVGKPSYYVALDLLMKKIVITIRGTESLRDSITDMQWRAVLIPNTDPALEWYGHEGIVRAASYIKEELENKNILERAFDYDQDLKTNEFELLIVGHSLGAGVAAILSILMKAKFANIKCYSYSPPGGLLSEPCMQATKEFITSVIVGKDMVPRLGMVQMEKLRNELMETLRNTNRPKVNEVKEQIEKQKLNDLKLNHLYN